MNEWMRVHLIFFFRFVDGRRMTAAAAVNGGHLPLPPVSSSLIYHLHPLLQHQNNPRNLLRIFPSSSSITSHTNYYIHRNGPLEAATLIRILAALQLQLNEWTLWTSISAGAFKCRAEIRRWVYMHIPSLDQSIASLECVVEFLPSAGYRWWGLIFLFLKLQLCREFLLASCGTTRNLECSYLVKLSTSGWQKIHSSWI